MTLTSLWAGMRTRAIEEAGTPNRIVLIINDNGHDDLLHHILPDTSSTQTNLAKGRSNLYEVPDVGPMNINPDNLQPSSIRVGIRGDEAWKPEDFFVFGEDNGTPIPLALARKITKILSTDPADKDPDGGAARLSIPIRPVVRGNATTPIFGLLVLMLTGAKGTDSPVRLRIVTPSNEDKVLFVMPPSSLDDNSAQGKQFHQEANEASFYYVDPETGHLVVPFTKSELNASSITLSLQEADDWLPASFFVFGIDAREATLPVTIVPLVHIPVWNAGVLEGPTPVPVPLPLI